MQALFRWLLPECPCTEVVQAVHAGHLPGRHCAGQTHKDRQTHTHIQTHLHTPTHTHTSPLHSVTILVYGVTHLPNTNIQIRGKRGLRCLFSLLVFLCTDEFRTSIIRELTNMVSPVASRKRVRCVPWGSISLTVSRRTAWTAPLGTSVRSSAWRARGRPALPAASPPAPAVPARSARSATTAGPRRPTPSRVPRAGRPS